MAMESSANAKPTTTTLCKDALSRFTQQKLRKSIGLKSILVNNCPNNSDIVHQRKIKTAALAKDLQCLCQTQSLQDFASLKAILPENYDYRVCSFLQNGDGFKASLRLPPLTPDKAKDWKARLENVSLSTFRVCRTFPGSGRYNLFKRDYACQHSTSRGCGKLTSKKTGCKAQLSLMVKRVYKNSRSRDKHMPEFPTCIFIRWCHNHSLDEVDSLRHQDVGEDAIRELVALHHRGHTPASAYRAFQSKLMNDWGSNFQAISQDRRILPEKQYVYRLFAKIKKRKSGQVTLSSANMDSTFEAFKNKVMVDVILPAAGSSTRMGTVATPKPFIKVLGSHIIAYTIDCFHKNPWVRHIVLVVSADRVSSTKNLVLSYGFSKVMVCEGSSTRHRSIHCGVQALRNECSDSSVVIIHDGARPFVSEEIIENVALSAKKHGAAGVVRPLVSTVVKGDDQRMLEMSLKRSDYRNSEMPQGFQYGIISGAYAKCSEDDFEYGTECLLLALKYSQCAAHLLDGDDYLWKVTYQNDLPLMETTLKVKYTKLSLIDQSSQTPKWVGHIRTGLLEKRLNIISSDKEGANTIVCFLDLPSSSSMASMKGENCAKQFLSSYNRLPKSVAKLNLMVVVVFVTKSDPSDSTIPSGKSQPGHTSDSASGSRSSSSFILPQSTPLNPEQTVPPHQQLDLTQHSIDIQQLHQHQCLPHQHQLQQQCYHPHVVTPGNGHQITSLSNTSSCSQAAMPVTDSFVQGSHYQYSRNPDSGTPYLDASYAFDNGNNDHNSQNQQIQVFPPAPQPNLPCLSQPNLMPISRSSSNVASCAFSPSQHFNICQEISFSDLQSPQNIFESHSSQHKGKTTMDRCAKGSTPLHEKEPEARSTSNTQVNSRHLELECSAPTTGSSDADMCTMRTSWTFMRSLGDAIKKAHTPRSSSCLVGVLCEDKIDVSDKLIELVWGRNQFLDGQVLSFT